MTALALANRDLMVYNEGEFTERHAYDRSFQRVSTTFTYMDDTARGEPGENIASDTAVNHIEKLIYRTNHLTSTLFAVDEDGAVALHMMYDEWGNPQVDTEFNINKYGVSNLNNYTGYTYDDVLGIYYAQARFYDAGIKRFIQEDPIKDGMNWYAYVGNNPVNKIDPTGLADIDPSEGPGEATGATLKPSVSEPPVVTRPKDNVIPQKQVEPSLPESTQTWLPLTPEELAAGADQFLHKDFYRQQFMLQDHANPTYFNQFGCGITGEQAFSAAAILVGGVIFAILVLSTAGGAAALAGTVLAAGGATTATVTAVQTTVLAGAAFTAASGIAITGAEVEAALTGYNPIRDGLLEGDLGMDKDAAKRKYEEIKAIVGVLGFGTIIAGGYYAMTAGSVAQPSAGGANAPDFESVADLLTRAQRRNVTTLNNVITKNLTELDFAGTLRDLQGNPVPKTSGGVWDHITEMVQSYTSLNGVRNGLEGSLQNPNLDQNVRIFLESELEKTISYIVRIEDLFSQFGGIQ